jgi:glycosyltransferase involved in cell wall biosynthesis
MPKVSIIVPVYNRASSIRFCLESLYAMHYRDFEVIVVDDGSSDDSPCICQEFCNTHPQFRYIRQDNGGVSNARNHGIREAAGEWITFVDSDDAVCPEHLSVVELEDKNDVDWILESFRIIGTVNDDVQIPSLDVDVFKTRVESNEPVKYVFTSMQKTDTPIFSTCGKFFKLSTCIQHGVRFNERLSLDEDQLFVSTYIQHVRKMVHYPSVRTYLFLDWGDVHLSGKLHTPEKYMEGYEINYKAFMELDRAEGSPCANFAANYMVTGSMRNIVFRYSRRKYQHLYSFAELYTFIDERIYPYYAGFKQPINYVSFHHAWAYKLIKHHHIKIALYCCVLYNIYMSVVFKLGKK